MHFADVDNVVHHDRCLGCGTANPKAIGLRLRARDGRVHGEVTFDEGTCGAPGYAHGGAVATVFDEALGSVPFLLGTPSVTANLTVDYRAAIRLGDTARVVAWPVRIEGRKTFLAAEMHVGDTLVAEATALFIEVPAERVMGAAPAGRW